MSYKEWLFKRKYEIDPLLKKEDREYYRKRREEIKEEMEISLIKERVKKRDKDWLGTWLMKFSEKGTWDLARYRNEKSDWL